MVEAHEGGNIDWQDRTSGHLVALTGWENRVQVAGGNYHSAAKLLGIDEDKCGNGVYPTVP